MVVENIIILKAPSSRCSEYNDDGPTGVDAERSLPNVPRADATARRPRPTLDHSASGCAVAVSYRLSRTVTVLAADFDRLVVRSRHACFIVRVQCVFGVWPSVRSTI